MDMDTLTTLYGALSDRSRLRIVHLLLRAGPLCVCDIERVLGFTQTKVSRHLGHLRNAGMVTVRREKVWKIYALASRHDPPFRTVCAQVSDLLADDSAALDDLKRLKHDLSTGCCATYGDAGLSYPARIQLAPITERTANGRTRDKKRGA